MTRIDELQKTYPTLPRDIIVKWEINRNGFRDTDDLDKAGAWMRAGASYIAYDHDVTMKETAERRPGRLRPGYVLRPPGDFRLKSGLGARIQLNTRSPYEIRELGASRFAIFEGEEMAEEIFFPRPKGWLEEPVTSKGTPISSLIAFRGGCFQIVPVRYCEYFSTGDQCKFCNFNPMQDDVRSIGLYRPTTVSLEEVLEAYKIRSSEVRIIEGRFDMGGFKSDEPEMKVYGGFVETLAHALPYKVNLTIHAESLDRKNMQRLKDAGLDCFTFQIEIWEPGLFAEILPGKAKRAPFERWLESMLEAVDVFGVGNVGCGLVGGLTEIPSNGHKNWEESRDSLIEGVRWTIKNGIMPDITHLRLPPGSVYGADPARREKMPPTEYYLDFGLAHHEAMMEQGLYTKLNKLMYCGMDCTTGIYCGEIGMLALAGDLGNWMADVLPEESNWLSKFIATHSK